MNHALQQKKQKNRTVSKPVSINHANSVKAVIQLKLKIGAANDKYEQEADRVADQVMRMPTPTQSSLINSSPTSTINNIQRKCAGCAKKDELIQKKPPGVTPEVTPTINSSIQSLQGGGKPLSKSERSFFEPRFGTDFSHVRLYTDSQAASTAKSINARAFTHGNNVVFGTGEYSSGLAGKKLMAHELTHVVQQSGTVNETTNLDIQSKQSENIQRARLPCTSRKTIDIFAVNLPGSTRSINNDLPTINSVLCQCGIMINVKGGVSINTNILDLTPPNGVLNTGSTATNELQQLLQIRPGGNAIHAYYVPSLSSGNLAEGVGAARYTPSLPDSILISNQAGTVPIIAAHELGHVLLNNGSHHSNRNNLMASGNINSGAGELEQSQCNRMP